MTDDETRALVRELYAAYARGDTERVIGFLDEAIDWSLSAPVEVFPFAGPRCGRADVLAALVELAAAYELQHHAVETMIVENDRAAVISDVGFIQRASGRLMRFRAADFLRFSNGRVVEFREFMNTFDVVEQALGRELPI